MPRMNSYRWILALAAALDQYADADPPGLEMARIDALAGELKLPPRQAANDMAARLLILVLVWWWCYAKSSAKTINSHAILRETDGLVFSEVMLQNGALEALLRCFALGMALCQNDHLPTLNEFAHVHCRCP